MRPVRFLLVGALALLAAGPASAEPYRDPAWHFTLDLPDGWERMSDEELATLNRVMRVIHKAEEAAYEVGFRPKGTDPGNYPYVLVQKLPGEVERATYAEIRKGFARALQMPVKSVEGTATEPTLGTAVLDKSRNRLSFVDKFKAPGVGPVTSLAVGHLGEAGVVFVHSYAEEDDFAKAKPTFDRLNDSFRYDLGYGFEPAGSDKGKGKAGKDKSAEAAPATAGPLPDDSTLVRSVVTGVVVTVITGAALWLAFKVLGGNSTGRRPRRVARRAARDRDDAE